MNFQPIDFLSKLVPFIENSPYGFKNIQTVPISEQSMGKKFNEVNSISTMGLGEPQINRKVNGDVYIANQANFYIELYRQQIDEKSNEELTNYISQFEQWVTAQNIVGKPPRFGSDRDFNEEIIAYNGRLLGVNEKAQPPFAVYQVFIKIKYQIKFEEEWN